MLKSVQVTRKSLSDYRDIAGAEAVDEILTLAEGLRGARVLHINSTAYGGGVAELLHTLVPLMRDAGVDATWLVVEAPAEFFVMTKSLHNALQGAEIEITDGMVELYLEHNRRFARELEEAWGEGYDFVVVHDPQPAALAALVRPELRRAGRWAWRCHIDLSTASEGAWAFLEPYVHAYDAAIFTMDRFVRPGLGEKVKRIALIPPSIDPLSPKNAPISREEALAVLARYRVDPKRPIVTQVSRFDPWKDPLGVIDAYRMAKREVPEVQLVFVGSMATDDPEGMEYYEKILRYAGMDEDIHVISNLHGAGNREVNAFQTLSDVVVQKSTREGFGLTVTEALWKARPVVAGKAGGITLQVVDGETGYLVESAEACAERILQLLRSRDLAERLGAAGRDRVRRMFLSTRHVRDYFKLFTEMAKDGN